MDYIDYRERLGLAFNDKEKQEIFITRVFSYLKNNDSVDFSQKDEKAFCYQVGIPTCFETDNYGFVEPLFGLTGLSRLAYYLDKRKSSFPDFLAMLVCFLNVYSGSKSSKEKLWQDIKKMMSDSHIQYELLQDGDNTFIFPKGAKELDKALVSEPLEWLSVYPDSRRAFVKALELYADSTDNNASNVADEFRKALERFFQEFFGQKDITLEKAVRNGVYGNFLKENGVPTEIGNDLHSVMNAYNNFMNNYAKHQDKAKKNVLEYIMYQTGNIIRLLITLKQAEGGE